MDRLKWLSIPITGVYIFFGTLGVISDMREEDSLAHDVLSGVAGMLFWLALSLGCIWYGEELGDGLVGARFGLISSVSPGWAVQVMGWVLLLLPPVLVLCCW